MLIQAPLNHRHLFYFWVVAKEGGITPAAERLGVAVQTISGQLRQFEEALGRALFAPQGRRLVLTEAGRTALGYADQIFLLDEQMKAAVQSSGEAGSLRLTVGISDALPKLIAYRLIEAALHLPVPVRLACYEGEFEELLGDLALHKFDVVLTDRPFGASSNLRVFSHSLGECEITIYAIPKLARRYRRGFPASLADAPLLLPTRTNALRGRLDAWLAANDLRPVISGEFEDSALMQTFGRTGLGLFPAPSILDAEIAAQFGAVPVGTIPEVREQFYAISNERRIKHPAVEAIRMASTAWMSKQQLKEDDGRQ
jgi:LysR family transcriptional activator of nhaA